MDRIECYVNGTRIGTGYRFSNGDIVAGEDDFEMPSHFFQTCMNGYLRQTEDQLQKMRELTAPWTSRDRIK